MRPVRSPASSTGQPLQTTTQPSVVRHGTYSGWVWLVPSTLWERGQLAQEFPPPVAGPAAIARKFHATLASFKLSLVPDIQDPTPTQVLEVDLHGVTVDLCRDALPGKSPWMRRSPLELSHSSRPLLLGESRLYMFAETGCAKEQWYAAFQGMLEPSSIAGVAAKLYQLYCTQMANLHLVALPDLPAPQLPPCNVAAAASAKGKGKGDGHAKPANEAGRPQKRGGGPLGFIFRFGRKPSNNARGPRDAMSSAPSGMLSKAPSKAGSHAPSKAPSVVGLSGLASPSQRSFSAPLSPPLSLAERLAESEPGVLPEEVVTHHRHTISDLKGQLEVPEYSLASDIFKCSVPLTPTPFSITTAVREHAAVVAPRIMPRTARPPMVIEPMTPPEQADAGASASGDGDADGDGDSQAPATLTSPFKSPSADGAGPLQNAGAIQQHDQLHSSQLPHPPSAPSQLDMLPTLSPQGLQPARSGSLARAIATRGSMPDLRAAAAAAAVATGEHGGGGSADGARASPSARRSLDAVSRTALGGSGAAGSGMQLGDLSPSLSKQDLKRLQREEQERAKQEQQRLRAAAKAAEEARRAEERTARARAKQEEAAHKRALEEAKARGLTRTGANKAGQMGGAAYDAIQELVAEAEASATEEARMAQERQQAAASDKPLAAVGSTGTLASEAKEEAKEEPPPPPPAPPPPPPTVYVEGIHGLNMLMVRIGWELLQSSRFEAWLRRRIQGPLDNIKRPGFIQPLVLGKLDLGTTAPQVKAVRAVAGPMNLGPGTCMWPQLALDIVWSGTMIASVSTKMDFEKSRAGKAAAAKAAAAATAGGDTAAAAGAAAGSAEGASTANGEKQAANAADAGASTGADGGGQRASDGGASSVRSDAGSDANPSAFAAGIIGAGGGGGGGFWSNFVPFKRLVDATAQTIASNLANTLNNTNVELSITVTKLEGTLLLWMAPPPSDRLWLSFASPPAMDLEVRPALAHRALSAAAALARVSGWIRMKISKALGKTLVYPACMDIRLGNLLMSIDSDGGALRPLYQGPLPADLSGAHGAPTPADAGSGAAATLQPAAAGAAAPGAATVVSSGQLGAAAQTLPAPAEGNAGLAPFSQLRLVVSVPERPVGKPPRGPGPSTAPSDAPTPTASAAAAASLGAASLAAGALARPASGTSSMAGFFASGRDADAASVRATPPPSNAPESVQGASPGMTSPLAGLSDSEDEREKGLYKEPPPMLGLHHGPPSAAAIAAAAAAASAQLQAKASQQRRGGGPFGWARGALGLIGRGVSGAGGVGVRALGAVGSHVAAAIVKPVVYAGERAAVQSQLQLEEVDGTGLPSTAAGGAAGVQSNKGNPAQEGSRRGPSMAGSIASVQEQAGATGAVPWVTEGEQTTGQELQLGPGQQPEQVIAVAAVGNGV